MSVSQPTNELANLDCPWESARARYLPNLLRSTVNLKPAVFAEPMNRELFSTLRVCQCATMHSCRLHQCTSDYCITATKQPDIGLT